MLDPESFLTELYVKVDDFDKTLPPPAAKPGQQPSLSRSELAPLALFAQWGRFLSERAFYRYAQKNLLGLFPRLHARTQFNRQLRAEREPIIDFSRLRRVFQLESELDDLLSQPVHNQAARNLKERFLTHRDKLLVFLHGPDVPPTNNESEPRVTNQSNPP